MEYKLENTTGLVKTLLLLLLLFLYSSLSCRLRDPRVDVTSPLPGAATNEEMNVRTPKKKHRRDGRKRRKRKKPTCLNFAKCILSVSA